MSGAGPQPTLTVEVLDESRLTRREGTVQRLLGDRGSAQRQRLRALPIIGPVLLLAVSFYRRVRAFRWRKQHEWKTAFRDLRDRHGMPRY